MDLLPVRALPFLTRGNYYYERAHILFWSVLAGMVEGQFAGIVVARTFDASPRLIAVAAATPNAAFLFSLFWGMLSVGRPKIRLLAQLCAGVTLLAGTVGLIPPVPGAAIWFIGQLAAAQILLAGVITLRSAVWRANYPDHARGRITARLQMVRFVVGISAVLVAAWACDHDPTAYRYVFPTAALLGVVGIALLRRIRIRGERSEQRHLRDLRKSRRARAVDPLDPDHQPPPESQDVSAGDDRPRDHAGIPDGLMEPFTLPALLSPGHMVGRMTAVLRSDRRFAAYLLAQSLMGFGNFMTIPVVVAVVTQGLDLDLSWGFWISTGVIQAVPQLVRLGSIGRWAKLFDRVGVLRFRVVNVSFWSVAAVFGLAATIVAEEANRIGPAYLMWAVALFAIRGVFSGIGRGGGSLAWNLGHLHFARGHQAEVYMGIHVFLTGLRGLIAPLVGMWLFQSIGWKVWLVALGLSLCSVAMYSVMARREEGRKRRSDEATKRRR